MMERYLRQSFLGADSERILRDTIVGIAGLGGGGSHTGQSGELPRDNPREC